MSDVKLSASLEVTPDGVESGVNKSITSLEALQNEIIKVQDQLAKASDDPSFNKLATKYNNLSKNIEILSKGEIKVAPVDLKPINDAGDAIEKVGTKTANLSNIMNRNLHGVADLFIAPGRAALIFANDLPILIQRFQELKAEQAALAAEGKESLSTTQLLGQSFNATGLAISVAAIALIHFLPEIEKYVKNIFDAKDATDELYKSLEKDSSYIKAIADVEKLTTDINLAKEGFISKSGVVKEYNTTIGKASGQIKTLSEAEDGLIKNKDAYIQMMLQKAIATEAFQKYAEGYVQSQAKIKIAENDAIKAIQAFKATDMAYGGDQGLRMFQADTNNVLSDLNKKLKDITDDSKKNNIFKQLGTDAEAAGAKISKSAGFNFFDDDKTSKAKTQAEKLSDAITQIQRKQESLNNAFSKGSITNVQYYKQSIDLLTTSIQNLHDKYNLPFDGKILSGLQTQLDKLKVAAPVNLTALKGDSGDINTIANYMAHIYDEANKEAVKQFKAGLKNENTFNDLDITGNLVRQLRALGVNEVTNPVGVKVPVSMSLDEKTLSKGVQDVQNKLKETSDQLKRVIGNSIDSISESIGTAIGSGDFSNIGSDFLEALGKGIEQFGEQIVERVTAFLALKNTLFAEITSGNWEAALATGVGLVVLGAAIEAFAKKGAKGSSSSTSTGSYASTYTPSYYSPSQTTSGSNTAASAFGGSTNIAANVGNSVGSTINNTMEAIPIEGSFELKGSNLYASVKRTEKNKTR